MSTKIYFARRIPVGKINDLIDYVRPQALKLTAEEIKLWMNSITIESLRPVGVKGIKKAKWMLHKKFEAVLKECYKAANTSQRDVFDIESGMNIWIRNKFAYIIPIFPHFLYLQKIKWPVWAKDYCYWNNIDPPKEVSQQEWQTRGKMWEQINCGEGTASHNVRRLYHSFVSLRDGLYVGSMELRNIIVGL